MPILYCIPGMGTDHRVFGALAAALPEIELRYWDYIEPLSPREPMSEYLDRCVAAWGMPEEPPTVLGMSLGGILATEWCKRFDYRRLFLVSTMHLAQERPFYFSWLEQVPIHRLVPTWFTRMSWGRWGKFLGITDAKGQQLLREMIGDSSVMHLRWGRQTAVHWKNEERLERSVRIHGTRDHVFPFRRVQKQCDYVIQGGTHCAIFNNATEIAEIIREAW